MSDRDKQLEQEVARLKAEALTECIRSVLSDLNFVNGSIRDRHYLSARTQLGVACKRLWSAIKPEPQEGA